MTPREAREEAINPANTEVITQEGQSPDRKEMDEVPIRMGIKPPSVQGGGGWSWSQRKLWQILVKALMSAVLTREEKGRKCPLTQFSL